jgi:hypothetical protein
VAVDNEKDLGDALNNDQDTIEIEGDLAKKVLKIKATGKVAWAVAAGAIGVAVLAVMYPVPEPTSQVASKAFAITAGGSAVTILGVGATTAAISIAVATGGVKGLNKLRSYKVISTEGDRVVLKK